MDRVEATDLELWGLYDIRATAYLNLLYYGSRAARWSFWNLLLQVIASIGSLGAVTVFLTLGTDPFWKWASASFGVFSAVCAVLPAIMGHAEKVNKFEKLHFAYCELFELVKRMVMDVRRAGLITDEQLGAAKLLNDLRSRLGRLEDTGHKDRLREKCEEAVLERFPVSSLWYAGTHADSQRAEPTAATETRSNRANASKGKPTAPASR
jgi:hypothetical protein